MFILFSFIVLYFNTPGTHIHGTAAANRETKTRRLEDRFFIGETHARVPPRLGERTNKTTVKTHTRRERVREREKETNVIFSARQENTNKSSTAVGAAASSVYNNNVEIFVVLVDVIIILLH